MASSEKDKAVRKKIESVRERAERAIEEASKPAKSQKISSELGKKTRIIRRKANKKAKSTADKKPRRFHIIPKFIKNAFAEIKLVTWPDRKVTFKLTTAVIIFSTVFGLLISLVDYGFGALFKRIFLHG